MVSSTSAWFEMSNRAAEADGGRGQRRLSKEERRRQLLDTALQIVRQEGADRLTLGYLASRAGVSKPVAYDHFGTRSGLLIELYKSIDLDQVDALRETLATGGRSREETVGILADAYIHCAADTNGDWHALGAALAGNEEKDAAFRELTEEHVRLFLSVLSPHSSLEPGDLRRYCMGLVGAGEALSAALVRGQCSEAEAAESFASLIRCGLHGSSR